MSKSDTAAAEARFMKAAQLFEAGNLAEAETECAAVLEVIPNQPDTLHLRGLVAFQSGRPQDAADHIRAAIGVVGDDPAMTYHLGEILRTQGALDEAEDAYRRALAVDPENAEPRFGLGNVLLQKGRAAEAAEIFREGLAKNPADVLARCQLGEALMGMGDWTDAIAAFEEARAAIDSGTGATIGESPELQLALGICRKETGETATAKEHLEQALALNPGLGAAAFHLANIALDAGDTETAESRFQAALDADPALAEAHVGLGVVRQQTGRFDEAAASHRAALAIQGNHPGAWYNLALAGEISGEDDIARIASLLDDSGPPPETAITLGFALGKALDDAGRADEAFARFEAANDLKAASAPFDPASYADHVDDILKTYTAAHFGKAPARTDAEDAELPVLVVGMPRSGTTLVEQIIAAHPQAAGAGELATLTDIAGSLPDFPKGAAKLKPADLDRLATQYAEALRTAAAEAGPGTSRIADKMPNNYLRLGLVAQMFPGARVIHCQRDPLDTALSAYFQNFTLERDYTARLDWLGAYHRQYARVMAHWATALPLEILDVSYEDLVADPEPGIRRIVEFLGLPWDDACLDFHNHDRRIRTFSFRQARQPVFTSSVGRAAAYETHLGDLKAALER